MSGSVTFDQSLSEDVRPETDWLLPIKGACMPRAQDQSQVQSLYCIALCCRWGACAILTST